MAPQEIRRNPEMLIGTSCLEVIQELLIVNPQIAKLNFDKYYYVSQTRNDLKDKPDELFSIDIDGNFWAELNSEIRELDKNRNIAISSRVTLRDGSSAHIPMMDFNLPRSPFSLTRIKYGLRNAVREQEGFILESGNSYHYYGLKLLIEENWIDFMGMCLLVNPRFDSYKPFVEIVDTRYVGHRLLDKACALRITTNDEKDCLPRVVAVL